MMDEMPELLSQWELPDQRWLFLGMAIESAARLAETPEQIVDRAKAFERYVVGGETERLIRAGRPAGAKP